MQHNDNERTLFMDEVELLKRVINCFSPHANVEKKRGKIWMTCINMFSELCTTSLLMDCMLFCHCCVCFSCHCFFVGDVTLAMNDKNLCAIHFTYTKMHTSLTKFVNSLSHGMHYVCASNMQPQPITICGICICLLLVDSMMQLGHICDERSPSDPSTCTYAFTGISKLNFGHSWMDWNE